MASEMSQFKATANAHMHRDIQAAGRWTCTCEACTGIRSLMGADKMLEMRPLIREIREHEERLQKLADGPEKSKVMEQYLKLHDKLADVAAK